LKKLPERKLTSEYNKKQTSLFAMILLAAAAKKWLSI